MKMKDYTIGVIIATYNGEKFIEEQLLSIINQTQKPDEIIVSDGMSGDDTVRICHAILSKTDINYRVLTSEVQLSVVENFQKALNTCTSDYIFFADQDDVWKQEKISSMMECIRKTGSVLAFSNATVVDKKLYPIGDISLWGALKYEPENIIQTYEKGDAQFVNQLLKQNVVTGMCMCISGRLKDKILPLSINTIHDYWIAMVACMHGRSVSINEELVLYRQHDSNAVGITAGINTSLHNSTAYKEKVHRKKKMLGEFINRNYISDDMTEIKHLIIDYRWYIEKRCDYLDGKCGVFTFVLKNKNNYKKYERKYLGVILRDIYSRLFL